MQQLVLKKVWRLFIFLTSIYSRLISYYPEKTAWQIRLFGYKLVSLQIVRSVRENNM